MTVVSTGAPLEYLGAGSAAEWRDLLSPKSRQIVERRSLHFASLRSAPVETTEIRQEPLYFNSSGAIRRGRKRAISGHTINAASTTTIGTSMISVSLSA